MHSVTTGLPYIYYINSRFSLLVMGACYVESNTTNYTSASLLISILVSELSPIRRCVVCGVVSLYCISKLLCCCISVYPGDGYCLLLLSCPRCQKGV
ncbi:hypothetical protein EB796_012183 [Bugula neritina]|uniref:Uncharacterized protein n=1 Tax=Bugula neritina TaxID=10212 RepID=A0A7J7JVX2_BUGNE|nr:hypothetical protein EB796_012183 [Bugula neritina]